MTTLMNLPNELLQKVVDDAYREDLVNLVSTCRRIFALSQSGLKRHRELQSRYGTLDGGGGE